MAFLKICDFSYSYPGSQNLVLENINLSLNQGDFVVITGKSGCGKSTLGKALAGFLFQEDERNFSGKIIIGNSDMAEIPLYEASEKVAYVQQNPEDQFCTLSVIDEIAFGLENLCLNPQVIHEKIDQALGIVKGSHLKDRKLSTLSGGEKQKVAIASLLALSPDVLILDEPTSNLDPASTRTIFTTLHLIRNIQGLTVIIFEHKLSQLLELNPILYELKENTIVPLKQQQVSVLGNSLKIDRDNEILDENKPPKEILIDLKNVNIILGNKHILKNIRFSLYQGEFIALMGANGSGKSTLLLTIMGLLQQDSGSCVKLDYPNNQVRPSQLAKDIGFIFQNPDHQIFTHTVWDEITFTCRNHGLLSDQTLDEAEQWLSKLGLEERKDDHPQRLSYGEKRRVNLISAILHKPRVLLIDEMLIGQDSQNAEFWMKFMQDYTKPGNSVILVNHHPDLTQAFCSRMLFLSDGDLIIDSPIPLAFKQLSEMGFDSFLPRSILVEAHA
jgi:energy-coupling factor transport system ATP-binding protein